AFGKQTGIALEYTAIDALPEDFAAALQTFADNGGAGANITLPHKQAAFALAGSITDRAQRAGAVNTLVGRDASRHGDNTYGAGLVRDLAGRHSLDLRGRRTLLIGAGGAARGVAPALLDAGIGDLYVVNRTPERADALVDAMGQPRRVHSRYLDDLRTLGEFDLIINATSATRGAELPQLPLSLLAPRTATVDLGYGEAAVQFMAWSHANGVQHAVDGLGMLVEHAAESFLLWHGVRPQTDAIHDALRERDSALINAD